MTPTDGFEAEEKILDRLEDNGFPREELPGPGDLHDAIWEAGYELKARDRDGD